MFKRLFSDTWHAFRGFSSSKSRVIDRSTYTLVPPRPAEPDIELQPLHDFPESSSGSRRLPLPAMEKTSRSRAGHIMQKIVRLPLRMSVVQICQEAAHQVQRLGQH